MASNNGNGHVGKLWLIRDFDRKLEPRSGAYSPSVETALEFPGVKGDKGLLSWKDLGKFSPKQMENIHVVHVDGTLAELFSRIHQSDDGHIGKFLLISYLEGSLVARDWEKLGEQSHKDLSKIYVVHVEGTLSEFLNRARAK
jgi:hypothetical protein